jgi:aromatic ring-opening dioxygenase LigB subunit
MIVFAAIVPHPPISIEGIGKKEDIAAIRKTLASFSKLRKDLEKIKPDVVVIISPHAPIEPYDFVINSADKLVGNFNDFNLDKSYEFKNDIGLIDLIEYAAESNELLVNLHPHLVDHGALIPACHLLKNINPNIVHLSFSLLNFQTHYLYGEVIGHIFENSSKRIAIIASGDLSHRLLPTSPAGYFSGAKFFDQRLIESLGKNDLPSILHLREEYIHDAAECGVRSFLIMLGVIKIKKYKFKLLSYEYPFGIGYLVARFI